VAEMFLSSIRVHRKMSTYILPICLEGVLSCDLSMTLTGDRNWVPHVDSHLSRTVGRCKYASPLFLNGKSQCNISKVIMYIKGAQSTSWLEEYDLLGCDAVWSYNNLPIFLRNELPPSSLSKSRKLVACLGYFSALKMVASRVPNLQ
jgi:hypothetical protein